MIGDLGGEPFKVNVRPGDWLVMYERDDENRIVEVTAASSDIGIEGGKFRPSGAMTVERESVDMPSGVLFCSDMKLGQALPKSYKVPERKLNMEIVERYGKPDDEGKSQYDRFLESCYHLCMDGDAKMPMCEGTPYGMVAWLDKGRSTFTFLKDEMRDIVGIDIRA